jgi:geranylgeranyl diphosphate synthase type I
MPLDRLTEQMLPAIEQALRQAMAAAEDEYAAEMYEMLAYHLGWSGEDAGEKARGKRIRPLLVTLTTVAAGGDWQHALPAAAAVELLHNFSLIHDDIQDKSPLRRGRPTVWQIWGIPQAINAGDAMFILAHQALSGLQKALPPTSVLEAHRLFQATCLALTQGQYLDMAYEARGDLDLEAYWPMVRGKTAALLAACTELGALVAEQDILIRSAYRELGHYLGLAFQVQDDLLGIWGDAAVTGKSNESDLLEGKKSLPVLFGLGLKGPFAKRWRQGPIRPEEVSETARQLAAEGAQDYAQKMADQLTHKALEALHTAQPQGDGALALRALADLLLKRKG